MAPGAEGDPKGPGPRPGALSALLQEIAAAPREGQGGAWEATLRPGATVGRFELVRELGRGGFGVVWEARDRELGRSVAFKAVRAGGKAGLREERLLREAEAAARLSHPSIVTLFDVGRAEQGPYLVLELLRGRTLAERLGEGPLPAGEAVRVGTEIAKGLAHAHGEGVVHRDLKPENVFLCQDGLVKVLDFGMAHAFGRRWQEGGTSGYMAPEQAEGAPEDERTDVWALGAILYEALSGKRLFEDEKALRKPAPALEVPGAPGLGELVGRMLSGRPVERPRDGAEVLAALSAVERELGRVPSSAAVPVRARRRPGRRGAALVAAGVVAFAAIAAAALWRSGALVAIPGPVAAPTPSIAVLPFADMSPGRDQEYLSEGIAEEILNALARVEGLRVVGRTSSWFFKGKNAKLADIGRELRVGSVLEGSVRREGSRLRVAAKLVAVDDGRALWTESYDRDLGDVFALEEGIAGAVVGALKVKLMADRAAVPEQPRTTPEAYLQTLLGWQHWNRGSRGDVQLAAEAFGRALAVDPRYAPAWAGLAWSLDSLADKEATLDDSMAKKRRAIEAAEKAVAFGPGVGSAYRARGGLRGPARHEWTEGLADVERGITLQGNDAPLHRVRAWVLGALGRLPEAIASATRATELEPLAARGWFLLGTLLIGSGDHATARRAYRRVLEIAPEHPAPPSAIARMLVLEGRPAEALSAQRDSQAEEEVHLHLQALAEHSLGHAAESRRALDALVARYAHSMAFQIAEAHAWRGERDAAFAWLERADAQLDGGIMMLKYSPFLRPLRADPRWPALLRKLKLPVE